MDDALLSRFERKIYVPLPDSGARKTIFQIHTKGVNLDGITHDDLAGLTNNFSGRDISNVCREAVASMIREQNSGLEDLTSKQIDSYTLKHRPLTKNDFDISLKKIKPVSDEADLRRFDKWKEEFGG